MKMNESRKEYIETLRAKILEEFKNRSIEVQYDKSSDTLHVGNVRIRMEKLLNMYVDLEVFSGERALAELVDNIAGIGSIEWKK